MTRIEWTDLTTNEVAGCTAVDDGCRHCYAKDTAILRPQFFEGLARKRDGNGSVWTGKILHRPEQVEKLLRTRAPKRVFHCSMGDIFHPDVPDEWIDHAFGVMLLTPHLLHQVLTRRVDRMADYLEARYPVRPLPNVVAMTSVVDQATADERLEHLRRCSARWRSVSYEPALGPVRFGNLEGIHQIIAGGESGPRARPPHLGWFRQTRDDCAKAGVAFFFKQHGEWGPVDILDWQYYRDGDPVTWEGDRHPSGSSFVRRYGKKAAGRELDGKVHDGEPWKWGPTGWADA